MIQLGFKYDVYHLIGRDRDRMEGRLEPVYLDSNRLDYAEVSLEVPKSGVKRTVDWFE